MRKPYKPTLSIFLLPVLVASCVNGTSRNEGKVPPIFSYVTNQVSYDGSLMCVVDDEERFRDQSRWYSLFLVSDGKLEDSVSLDPYSLSGASPESLFLWRLSKVNLVCLKYRMGEGVGSRTIAQTGLFVFSCSDGHIREEALVIADSLYHDAISGRDFTVESRIVTDHDTMFVMRTGWLASIDSGILIRRNIWNSTVKLLWDGGAVRIHTDTKSMEQ